MGLQGDLTSFDAADVLRLLSWTKKSGTLDLSGDRGHGLIRVLDGKVVGGDVDGARTSSDAEIVYELLRFRIGTFLFEDGEPRADRKPAPVDDVLAGAATLLSEWKAIESVVPDFDQGIRLVPDVTGDEVRLSLAEWRAVVGLGGGGSVRDLGERLDVSDLAVGATVKGLIERGMVTLDDEVADEVAYEGEVVGVGEEPTLSTDPSDPSDASDDGTTHDGAPNDGAASSLFAERPEPADGGGIRLDYEPGFDGAPAGTLPASAAAGYLPAQDTQTAVSSARDAVESGRATDRRPFADLGAVRRPSTHVPPAPPPPPSAVVATAARPANPADVVAPATRETPVATETGTTWQPAWAPSTGSDIPTVGDLTGSDDVSGRKKTRRRFRRD